MFPTGVPKGIQHEQAPEMVYPDISLETIMANKGYIVTFLSSSLYKDNVESFLKQRGHHRSFSLENLDEATSSDLAIFFKENREVAKNFWIFVREEVKVKYNI